MSRNQERLSDYLEHVLEAIRRVERYTANMDEPTFMGNEMAQDAVIRNIEIIGEASHNIEVHYPKFAAEHPTLPLAFAYQMRNAVAHGYSKVDLQIVWRTVKNDLPELLRQIQTLALSIPEPGNEPRTRGPRP